MKGREPQIERNLNSITGNRRSGTAPSSGDPSRLVTLASPSKPRSDEQTPQREQDKAGSSYTPSRHVSTVESRGQEHRALMVQPAIAAEEERKFIPYTHGVVGTHQSTR